MGQPRSRGLTATWLDNMRVKLSYTSSITLDLFASVKWTAPGAREFGTADFSIPRAHPSLTYAALGSYLRLGGGSLVEIETPSLGLWRGIIATPVWSAAGVQVHAMHITYLLNVRIVARSRVLSNLTAGAIFAAGVNDALNGIGAQVLRPGTFLEAAPVIPSYEFRGQPLAQVGTDLNQATGQEWRISDDGAISWIPPRGTLYERLMCDDGDIVDVVKSVDGTEQAAEFIARDNAGHEYIAVAGNAADSLLRRQQLVSVNTVSAGAAGLAAEAALAGARGTPATYTLRLKQYSGQ